jgi:hypothetical protein
VNEKELNRENTVKQTEQQRGNEKRNRGNEGREVGSGEILLCWNFFIRTE